MKRVSISAGAKARPRTSSSAPLGALVDPQRRPSAAGLRTGLGGAQSHWTDLVTRALAECPALAQEWHFAGPKFGWALRLKQRDRVVVHLLPDRGRFHFGVLVGAKRAAEGAAAGLSRATLAILDAAPRYAEGIGVRIPVARASDLRVARELLALKLSRATSPAPPRAERRTPKPA